jgi:hypothetical protein
MIRRVLVLIVLATAPTAGQTGAYHVPRTPWGDRDLQGIWPGTAMMGVPLERPADVAGQARLLARDSGYGMFEYACHEGNYGLRNILSAARAADR